MKTRNTKIAGCLIVEPERFEDQRGWFYEGYQKSKIDKALGRAINFVQDNYSHSHKGVIRGLHLQRAPYAQAKLVQVLHGCIRDVVVDLRKDSMTYLEHVLIELNSDRPELLFIPEGLAHGFLSVENDTLLHYKCSAYYNPKAEAGIRFDDPDLAIDWGIDASEIRLSEKDRNLPLFKSIAL
ncbi:dTDP-4-dehydrorhamnose 3,5-epimerase [Robiginitalea sp. SC105]|uniref:dTDP-4-dehydrorhamnose 3,5-epimerase n=1 Tax=Robiginitalea sp. SC105 TaxID=2762332 RepID=UPI00163AD0AE|nr:dTDP-4-dehydrorhamnose 3,5-epimerase [Robiginitalea sp. SC105]